MPLHVINFTGPVTASTCSQLIEKASLAVQQEASGLVVNIATMGGECSYGFTMYNFLLALPIAVHTHNLGTVESMGNIIFLAGERRTACKHSKFLFHPFHWHVQGAVDHSRMSEYAMSLDYDLQLYARIVEERTQDAKEKLETEKYLIAAPRILDPQQAMTAGLIHGIELPVIQAEFVSSFIHS
ncbi:ATP-dependent Clp protease proteolytic subunit [Pseudomonas fluorescens]|uniref:ATP-dependent Clp protease proteolytic subunit n=1 Tax=Pseudomonas TaxID=286 RepID=UPI000C14C725|nr:MULTISPECIES: ATP-dependent Clp protease proteolytic subunit [Pseudomonas]KAE9653502.1 Clp protease [Pseudomonas sp. PB105]MBD8194341.1 ATP-dependent Clp protease proteolytic subunit [Pseudomonas fluorescens]MBD8229224.1 ATP-dependent Clp protease proteolytic subunit [Pseudomonas fluorescens]MBD8235590.1 ATP-dependent Clp protease proteolytic subunit [Pseudomonas fluorescens]MBD8787151.1 ATP-dependent Clp protease proteolytic subunit [Pseudomonas fluorescens]